MADGGDFLKKKTMIMFSTNSTALILGRSLISADHNLSLYCPNNTHLRQAGTTPTDLKIAALGLGLTVDVVSSLETADQMDMIIIVTLDLMPFDKRSDYADMCRKIFRDMKVNNVKFKDTVSVIFGSNISGLICAKEFGDNFPDLRKAAYITCSVYHTSKQVYSDSDDRVFPMIKESGKQKLYFTGTEHNNALLKDMMHVWDSDDFCLTEAASIMELVSAITELQFDLTGLEMIGRFPSETEATQLDISYMTPVWLSTSNEGLRPTSEMMTRLRRLSDWMESGYGQE